MILLIWSIVTLCVVCYALGYQRGVDSTISILREEALKLIDITKPKKIYAYAMVKDGVIYIFEQKTDRFIVQGVTVKEIVEKYINAGNKDFLHFDPENADSIRFEYDKDKI